MENEEINPTAKRTKRLGWIWIALAAIAAVGGGVWLVLSLTRGTELTEMDAWNRVGHFQATNELDSLENALNDYLWTYSDGRYAEDARTLRDRLKREQDEWYKVAEGSPTVKSVDEFLYAHPDGFYRGEALDMLDSLSFMEAKEQNSEDALLAYMEQYPSGKYAKNARSLLKDIDKQEATEEEQKAAVTVIQKHFDAMQENSSSIVTTMADNVSSYIGKPNPTVEDVLAYMQHFHKGKKNKALNTSDFSVKKMMQAGEPMYSVEFRLKETISDDDSTNTEVKQLTGKAILNARMEMTSLVLKQ